MILRRIVSAFLLDYVAQELLTGVCASEVNHTNTNESAAHEEKRCEVLSDKHGHWEGSLEPGGTYVLTCDGGFAVDGKPQMNMTCSSSAEWPAKPWCEDIDDCALLLYGCGPAGLCNDLQDGVECVCERGARRDIASNGEVVCHFKGNTDCGGRNCGSHGVCVHLKQYQNTFDTGNSSFRCSCEQGYMDDGESCVASDCGPLEDPFGVWQGSHAYLGEYTLECKQGAFVWGGTEQATTISCPSFGRWRNVPRCLSALEESRKAEQERLKVFIHVIASATCILMAALAAGLTMGLVSLEPVELHIIEAARLEDCSSNKEQARLQKQKDAAKLILPLLKDHHLLLVTLLLLNALANEALPIFLDDLLSPFFAVLLSVTFVLVCGEILPSAIFTGPWQLTASAWFIPVVKFLLGAMYCIAKPIAKILDKALTHSREERFSRPEIRAVLRLHSPSGCSEEASGVSPALRTAECLLPEEDPVELPCVLEDQEVELCLAVMRLGDMLVADSPGFYTLKQCARRVMPVDYYSTAIGVAADAVSSNKDFVVVFPSTEHVQWPVEVAWDEISGILRTSELLEMGARAVGDLCTRKHVQKLEAHDTVADALAALAETRDGGFGVVLRGEDFFGIFDAEEALAAVLMNEEPAELPSPGRLARQRREAGLGVGHLRSDNSRSDFSPSSGNTSPGREPVPEAAQLTGLALREIAQLTLEDQCPRITESVSMPLPRRLHEPEGLEGPEGPEPGEVTKCRTIDAPNREDRFGVSRQNPGLTVDTGDDDEAHPDPAPPDPAPPAPPAPPSPPAPAAAPGAEESDGSPHSRNS
ncbi:unnamed protein product [Effrenium voratum]|uniref:Uncharacterized protein n=1 Tax=Effrenium voratum TaxID=2562239 RepID=A0AA36MPR2_9DINO|nr:unnamed protein product [Effrenium voratum]